MSIPILLDLYCGAGGASVGYARAGFWVVGVDARPQPRYPFYFIQADALRYLDEANLSKYSLIHASPPCQAYSLASLYHGHECQDSHSDLVSPTRERLERHGIPWVIENVPQAPIRKDLMLCGEMFDLRVHRHRHFETNGLDVPQPIHEPHKLRGARHNCHIEEGYTRIVAGHYSNHPDACDAMDIHWMVPKELVEAIPPAYTEHIGRSVLGC